MVRVPAASVAGTFFYFAPSREAAKFLKKNSVSLWLCENHLKILCVLASWRENFYAVYEGRFYFERERIAGKIRVPLRRGIYKSDTQGDGFCLCPVLNSLCAFSACFYPLKK